MKGIDLKQIGKNIIQGLINGIGSMANAVWRKVGDIADGLRRNHRITQHSLAITMDARSCRKMIPAGVAVGIDKAGGLVEKLLRNWRSSPCLRQIKRHSPMTQPSAVAH
ncbi:hypothetical protein PO124_31610 [Bacillus licheniformis]|nr:hypothetical protein [Bacillus licheniformis]